MWTHFCKFFEDFATLLYLNANLYICCRERIFSTNWTTLIVSCLLLTKHVSTFLFILRLVRGLILFTLCVLKLPLETNVCIAIYLSFHMAVSLDDIITLWVEVQRSMIIDHLFSPKEFWWFYGKLQQASHRQTVANSSIELDYINTKLHWPTITLLRF